MRWDLLCSILCLGLALATSDVISDDSSRVEELDSEEDVEEYVNNGNLSLMLKFATECETPDHRPGLCIEIENCLELQRQITNIKAKEFLNASQCGPKNQDPANPKVCCGLSINYQDIFSKDVQILPKKCGLRKVVMRSRILGGTKATLGEFPWMALLVHKNEFSTITFGCSAFLIHKNFVLTAAHCVHSNFTKIRGPIISVVLGEHNIETKVDCNPAGTHCADPLQISHISKVIIHQDYNVESTGHYNDIALIRMKKAARNTDFVSPICLKTDNTEWKESYVISGWGRTETDSYSTVKRKVELPPVDYKECKQKFSVMGIEIKNTQICAGGEEDKDSCTGDSGGPLMAENGTHFMAAGIVSYGIGCGVKDWPGVYTNIPSYLPWIKQQIILNKKATKSNHSLKQHANRKH